MSERELICIGCPMGCPIVVKMEDGKVISVTGNTCQRGEAYARKEVTDPTRIVTTTVRVADGKVPMINVKTEHDIPKDKIFDCIAGRYRCKYRSCRKCGCSTLDDCEGDIV